MMKALTFSLFFSLSVLAQDYTLMQFENDNFRSYSRQELMDRVGANSVLIPYYVCNNVNEFDPFFPAPRENSKRDSLQIKLSKGENLIYREGKFYQLNGEEILKLTDSFAKSAAKALARIEEIPEGAKLLRNLERSYFPLDIAASGTNMFKPNDGTGSNFKGIYRANMLSIFDRGRFTVEEVPFNDVGAGGTVLWNHKATDLHPHISLMHEMYHAFDSIRGLLDMRFVKGEHYEQAMLSEYRAVFFENLARDKAGLKLRTHYGNETVGPGVLDPEGNPRWMPSPCLRD